MKYADAKRILETAEAKQAMVGDTPADWINDAVPVAAPTGEVALRLDEDGKLRLRAPARLAGYVSTIPGLRAVRDTDEWVGLASWSNILAIGSEFRDMPGFAATSEVEEIVDRYMAMEGWANKLRAGMIPDRPFDERLFEFQKSGVAMLTDMERVLLLDEMGTGKTAQALAAARQLWQEHKVHRILVVSPNNMKHRWARECETWFPEAAAYVMHGSKQNKQKVIDEVLLHDDPAAVVVTVNWEGLRTLSRLAPYGSTSMTAEEKSTQMLNRIQWDLVIADEVHKAKGPANKQTRGLWQVSKDAPYRWGLTGTPLLNTPSDLWSLGRFIAPEEYARSRQGWCDRFVHSIETHFGLKEIGVRRETIDELHRILDMRSIRRLKRDVLPHLPPITRQVRVLEMMGTQATAYRKMQKSMLAELEGGILVATDSLTKDTRLHQLASATPVIEELPDPDTGELVMKVTELSTPSNKINALIDDIVSMAGQQLVVFSKSRLLLEAAARAIDKAKEIDNDTTKVALITGKVDAEMRDILVQSFQRGEIQVVLVSLGAGSEGVDLFAADTAIFLNRSHNYDQSGPEQQAESRIHRQGQDSDKVLIIDYVSKGTVDEDVLEAVLDKARMANEIIRDTLTEIFKRKV
ncbi:MAG: DEAD/DEAH box helicase [candidate division NC10 bacterium]